MNTQKLHISLAEMETESYETLNCKSGSQFNSGKTTLSPTFSAVMQSIFLI